MKIRQFITVALLSTAMTTTALAKTAEVYDSFTDDQLVKILKDGGYSSTEISEKGAIRVNVNGRFYMLYNTSGDGDLVSYYGITGVKVDETDMNEWNRSKRLSRAYLDKENDPVLESDLLSDAGISKAQVQEFFRVFISSVESFRAYVDKNDNQ